MFRPIEGYKPLFTIRKIETVIKEIKDMFERELSDVLNLERVTAPIFVKSGLGINDDLNGVEQPVRFYVKDAGMDVEIVQSLAKWKRLALKRYGFTDGEGLYTDMNAIRADETLDHLHSFYVDQWDWEKVISPEQRNVETLKDSVNKIYDVLLRTEAYISKQHPHVTPILPSKITFISSEELLNKYPGLSSKERENAACKEFGAVFVIGVGGVLSDGSIHDGRAPDYDDWSTLREDGGTGLNGDILVWHPVLRCAFELSSMGIRVDSHALKTQLQIRGQESKLNLDFHRRLIEDKLPQTMGGGIGQSRLCMLLCRTSHIGEVACGVWPIETLEICKKAGIVLL